MKFRGTNFLEIFNRKKAEKRRFFIFLRVVSYIVAFIVAVSFILTAIYFGVVRDVYSMAQSGKYNLELASREVENFNFKQANSYLLEAEKNFEEAKNLFNYLKFLLKIHWMDDQYEAVANLLNTGIDTASALRDVIGVVGEIMEVAAEAQTIVGGLPSLPGEKSFANIPPEKKREILQKLFESPPRLMGAKAKIDLALISLDFIKDERVVSQILKIIKPVRETLVKLQATINKAIPAAEILPQIAGYPAEKTYLFLLQNSDEIRPTGGFIGTYGIVKVKDGEVSFFETYNIYALDGPAEKFLKVEPPAPVKKYLKVSGWFMRDSNWFPDFPTSAAQTEWFYHAEGGPEQKIDAVIAVTPSFIEDILRQIGNIEMNGEIFTPENLMEVLQYKVEKEYYEKGIPEIKRKDIVGELGKKIFDRLANLPSSNWLSLLKIVEKSLEEKHLLLWSKSSELQAIISREGWSGEVKSFNGDYLMVVDANLASLKTDSVMDKKINYSFAMDSDGNLRARVDINYKNKGTFSWKTTRYRTYTRIYVPRGSILIGGSGMMENDKILDPLRQKGKIDVGEEFDKTYFGAFISIEPGEERTLSFEYILPTKIKDYIRSGIYKLLIQKQAGTKGHPLTLNLNFGKKVKQAIPAEESKEWGDAIYKLRTDLRVDREFEVGF